MTHKTTLRDDRASSSGGGEGEFVVVRRLLACAVMLGALVPGACASSADAPHSAPSGVTTTLLATASIAMQSGTRVGATVSVPTAPATGEPEGASTPTPAGITPARVVYRGNAARRMVALTFDAGSDAGYTTQILDTLRDEHVRASFGVTGLWAEQDHALILAITAAGHQLINHTYDHASFTGVSAGTAALTPAQRASELQRTETTIYHLTGRSTRPYFRPPYGDLDAAVPLDAALGGYDTVVMWTVDTLGWQGASADAIVARALTQAEPGAIYVMHVGSQSQDAAALPRIIDGLRAQGYGFGSVDDVLAP